MEERREGKEKNPVRRASGLAAVGFASLVSLSSPSIVGPAPPPPPGFFSQSESVDSQLPCPLNHSLMSCGFSF